MSRYLAVCAIYRNEGPFLREWVEFHRLVGVERFFLYDNRSTDGHLAALAPYLEDGTVELTDWPLVLGQLPAYEDCLKRHREEWRWIAFIDLDEFLFSPTGRPVSELLVDYERWPGVGVNWAVFGPGGHRTRPSGLVIESYLRRTADKYSNQQIKSIVQPGLVRNFCSPHFFVYKSGLAVDENMRPINGPPFSRTDVVSFSHLRINHYTTKSEQEYRNKVARSVAFPLRSSTRRDDFTDVREMTEANIARRLAKLDEVTDETILRYLPTLREALAEIEKTSPSPALVDRDQTVT